MHAINIYSLFSSSAAQVATQRVEASWSWYVIRAAGFVAMGLLILLMLSGIGQVTGFTYRFIEPIKAWVLHKTLAFALCLSIIVHVSFLLIDHYISFSLVNLLIPFTTRYNNGTHLFGLPADLAISFGVLAMYGVIILVASSLGWIDTKKSRWRKLHYISYFVMLLAFLHALGSGTDLKYGLFRAIFVLAGIIVTIAIVGRLWRAGTIRNKGSQTDEKL
jgi:predicted ferric reductase